MNEPLIQPGPHYGALLQLLRTSEAIWNASRVFFDQWDLSPSQFNILSVLRDHPSGTTQIDLSRRLIMHRSNVTGMIDRLERRGLVSRQDSPGDRRAYRIVLTRAARTLLEEILPAYHASAAAIFDGFPIKRSRQLAGDLACLEENVTRFAASLSQRTRPPQPQIP